MSPHSMKWRSSLGSISNEKGNNHVQVSKERIQGLSPQKKKKKQKDGKVRPT